MGYKKILLILFLLCCFAGSAQAITAEHAYFLSGSNVSAYNITSSTTDFITRCGTTPNGIALSPDNKTLYVSNTGTNNVTVLNATTGTIITSFATGNQPNSIIMNPDGTKVYVANKGGSSVYVVDTQTYEKIATIYVSTSPMSMAINHNGTRLYVANYGVNTVSVINTTTNTVISTIQVLTSPLGMSISPDDSTVYVSNTNNNSISVINTSTNTVTSTIPVGKYPRGSSVVGDKLYVNNYGNSNVSVINTTTKELITSISVGSGPQGSALNSDSSKLYVGNYLSGSVSVINTTSNALSNTITGVGGASWGLFIYTPSSIPTVPPTASFTALRIDGVAPLIVNFIDSSENAFRWNWSFGDGDYSTEQNPTHTYLTGGTFDVSLNASNVYGSDVESKTGYLTIQPPPQPTCNFSSNITNFSAPHVVQFNDLSESTSSWNWSFGDGTYSNIQNPTHNYTVEGNYTVSLNASNTAGFAVETKESYINVDPTPGRIFYVSPTGTGNGTSIDYPGNPTTLAKLLRAGDSMLFLPGLYQIPGISQMNWVQLFADGTARSPITIKPYAPGTVYINGTNITNTTTGELTFRTVRAFDFYRHSYIIIDGFNITNVAVGVYNSISYSNCAGNQVRNCTIRHTGGSAIETGTYQHNMIIDNCTLEDNKWNSVGVYGTHTNSYPCNSTNYRTYNVTVSNCIFLPPYGHGVLDIFGECDNLTIYNNTLYNDQMYYHSSDQRYYTDWRFPENMNVSYNTVIDSYTCGLKLGCNNSTIANNTIYNTSSVGISFYSFGTRKSTGNLVVNNTVQRCRGTGIYVYSLNGTFKNNNVTHSVGTPDYRFDVSVPNTILDPVGSRYYVTNKETATTYINYSDGRILKTTPAINPILTTSGSSYNYTIQNISLKVEQYPLTIKPQTDDVTVTSISCIPSATVGSNALNITANSTNENVVNFTMWDLYPSGEYIVSRDGTPISTVTADSSGKITWSNSVWSEHVITVYFNDATPVIEANFTSDKTSGSTPLLVNFSDISDGTAVSWAWDFDGDGFYESFVQNSKHRYSKAGLYNVSLIVTQENGATDTETKLNYVNVSASNITYVRHNSSSQFDWWNWFDLRRGA